MRYFAIAIVLFLGISCSNENSESKNNGAENENASRDEQLENVSTDAPELKDLKFDVDIDSKETSFKGEIVASASWKDGRGKNILIISEKPQYFWKEENPSMGKLCKDPENESEVCELFAFHYIWSEDENKWKAYWTINDFLFGCCDVYMNYQKGSLKIEDSDKDGNAETVFFYTIGAGTNSIDRYFQAKLMYHTDETKLKAEGTTGAGKAMFESTEYNGKPVETKYSGFTGPYEKYKTIAEKYWNECNERQLKIDEQYHKSIGMEE